jgi:hypothetical protein
MIKKLPEIQIHSCAKINEKLNEVIDWVNDVSAFRVTDKQVTANLPNIDAGELAFLSKENSDLKDELDSTRKALEIAVDAIKNATEYLGNQEPLVDVMAMNLHTDLSKALEQITALEQKD